MPGPVPSAARFFALTALAASALVACGDSGAKPDGPNVLVITVDTLRADRLGCYGYERDTSPNLDAFAGESIRFERAYSQAPFTAPSHASLFTSLHSNEHGVLSWGIGIPAEARTMAERFRDRGFATAAFYNHPTLASCDVERGFEHVEKRIFEPADDTIDGFLAWLDDDGERGGGGDAPFCAWVHLWDVRRPFGYRDWSQFSDYVTREPFAFEEQRFGSYPDVRVGRVEPHYNVTPAKRVGLGIPEDGWRFVEDRYDGGVWYADSKLGRLFEEMSARGLFEDTIVVVTSDHGESLRERDPVWFTHDPYLYEETLHVPLFVRLPGGERGGEVRADLARGVDVLPTLLEACDLPATGRLSGESLLTPPADPRLLYAQTQTRHPKEGPEPPKDPDAPEGTERWFERREIVFDGRHKLYVDRGTGERRLFDVERDPAEREDVSVDPMYAAELARLEDALAAFRLLPPAGKTIESLSEAEQKMLADIGYAGSEESDEGR